MDATQASLVAHSADMPAQATEDQMLRWLSHHYRALQWCAIPQVTVALTDLTADPGLLSVGMAKWEALQEGVQRETIKDRRIDLLLARRAKNPEKCGPLETMAIEVKVSRADFLSDIKDPSKQAPWRKAATRHAYAVPAGLVQAAEVPAESGLAWVHPPAYAGGLPVIDWVRRAPFVPGHQPRLPFRVLIALLWRVSNFESTTRGWHEPPAGQRSEQDLRAQLAAANAARDRAERLAEINGDRADSWRLAYTMAAPDGAPCRWCGLGLKPLYPRGGGFKKWLHNDAGQNDVCANIERRKVEDTARDAYDAASDVEREREVRIAHRYGFTAEVEQQPWRAFVPPGWQPTPLPVAAPESDLPGVTV